MMILDGGMGQELLRRTGATPTRLWSAQLMMDDPDIVRTVHDDFFAAGAQIATTNTYTVHHDRLVEAGKDDMFEALHLQGCALARAARDAHGRGLVAGSLGPLGGSYRPEHFPELTSATELYAEIVAIHAPLVDVHLIETVVSLAHAEAALTACASSDKPTWIAFSVADEDGTHLRSGTPVEEIAQLVERHAPAAVLFNCSRPEAVTQALRTVGPLPCPTGAYANGFVTITEAFKGDGATVDALQARTDLNPKAYLAHARIWADQGATMIGGCCEVGPDHIRALTDHFQGQPKGALT